MSRIKWRAIVCRTPEEVEKVQLALFSLNYTWSSGHKGVKYQNSGPCLIVCPARHMPKPIERKFVRGSLDSRDYPERVRISAGEFLTNLPPKQLTFWEE